MGGRKQKSLGKILVVTPRFPVPPPGACEKDRYYNLLQLRDLGYEVSVLSKVSPTYDTELALKFSREQGISVKTVPYEFKKEKGLFYWLGHLLPWNWDGAAYEYSHGSTLSAMSELLDSTRPDLVWFDYTYLWPLYAEVKKRKIPVITRSINFEARHFLQEDGYTLINLIRFVPKFISELITINLSDWIFAITPAEKKTYERYGGAGKTSTLPLRGLAHVLDARVPVKDRDILKVFFMGSTYNVHHNKAALEYVVREIAPLVEARAPGKFIFHILGKQIPKDLEKYIVNNVKYVGYQDPKIFLQDMDIAVIPSLFGAGMQQKVFEPMDLGLPLVTHTRAIVGYPFVAGTHYLRSETPSEFASEILRLGDINLRRQLSEAAHNQSVRLFSQTKLEELVLSVLSKLLS